jgi:hypothetical protein
VTPRWIAPSLFALAVAVALVGAAEPADAAVEAPDLVDVAEERGLDFECQSWNKRIGLQPRFFIDSFFCPSPVVADLNGDGHLDLFLPNQRYTNATLNERQDPQDGFYLNRGDGTFRDVTGTLGVDDDGDSMAAAALDHDGDGDLDLYVANYPRRTAGFDDPATTLYENTGSGFVEREAPGLRTGAAGGYVDAQFGSAAAVADYDRDGDMDVYRGNYAKHRLSDGMPDALQQTEPDTNNLYENRGDGTFQEVTFETQASQAPGRTFAVNFVDLDDDRWPDLYVANDENPNKLYLNRDRPDTGPHERVFVDVSSDAGVDDGRGAMCSEPADLDNDGNLDLYMTHYEDERNGYYRGQGGASWQPAHELGDLGASSHMLGWGCPATDLENDGDRDLFVANGHMTPTGGEFFHPDDPADDNGYGLPNDLYVNTLQETGTHSLVEASGEAGPALDARRSTSGAEAADLDRDGYEEIVAVNNNAETAAFLDDEGRSGGSYLVVDPRSPDGNRFAVGAEVTVEAGNLTLVDQRITGNSLASGNVAPLHFGLGDAAGPAEVTVDWPDGATSTHSVELDQHVGILQGQGPVDDALAPRPTVTVDGEPADGVWTTGEAVTVSLEARDAGSGLVSLEYRLDDGPLQAYEGPVTITEPGDHTLVVVTEDQAGNRAWFPHRVALDGDAPDAAITRPEEGRIHVQSTSTPNLAGGTGLVAPRAVDAGPLGYADRVVEGLAHESARQAHQLGAEVAVPYPESTREALAGTAGSDGETTVEVAADDATSGIDRVVFRIDGERRHVDDEAPYRWDADLRGASQGEHTIRAEAYDEAGHVAADERTVEVLPTSAGGAQASAADLSPHLGTPGAPKDDLGGDLPPILSPEAGKDLPLRYAEDDGDRHWFETGQEPDPTRVGSYLPANERDAPIWRQFSFISDDEGGTVGQYVVLNPDTFLTDPGVSNVYQFPGCDGLDPVLDDPVMKPRPPGGEDVAWDQPTRRIVNVELETGCETQPTSADEVRDLAVSTTETELYVNAPKIPEEIADLPDEELFNAPPYRPRIDAYQSGGTAQFITYEASWMEPWIGMNFPGTNDVLILAPSPTFRPDFTIFNVNVGAPNHPDVAKYSPVWKGVCIVPSDNKKCMIGANERAGFEQPRTVVEALTLDGDGDGASDVEAIPPNTFTHVNCPFVAVDQNDDDYVQPNEELRFPSLWVDGPVIVN